MFNLRHVAPVGSGHPMSGGGGRSKQTWCTEKRGVGVTRNPKKMKGDPRGWDPRTHDAERGKEGTTYIITGA